MITDYDSLVEKIASFGHRSDLGSEIPTFIQLGEAYLSGRLKVLELETVEEETKSSSPHDLPSDFAAIRYVIANGRMVDPMSEAQAAVYYRNARSGPPQHFVITGRQMRLHPFVADVNVRTVYWRELPAITASNPTSEVLTRYPHVYLNAALVQLFSFTMEMEQGLAAAQALEGSIMQANGRSFGAAHGNRAQVRAV